MLNKGIVAILCGLTALMSAGAFLWMPTPTVSCLIPAVAFGATLGWLLARAYVRRWVEHQRAIRFLAELEEQYADGLGQEKHPLRPLIFPVQHELDFDLSLRGGHAAGGDRQAEGKRLHSTKRMVSDHGVFPYVSERNSPGRGGLSGQGPTAALKGILELSSELICCYLLT